MSVENNAFQTYWSLTTINKQRRFKSSAVTEFFNLIANGPSINTISMRETIQGYRGAKSVVNFERELNDCCLAAFDLRFRIRPKRRGQFQLAEILTIGLPGTGLLELAKLCPNKTKFPVQRSREHWRMMGYFIIHSPLKGHFSHLSSDMLGDFSFRLLDGKTATFANEKMLIPIGSWIMTQSFSSPPHFEREWDQALLAHSKAA